MKTDILTIAEAYEKETGRSRLEWTAADIQVFSNRLHIQRQKEGVWPDNKSLSVVHEQTADNQ